MRCVPSSNLVQIQNLESIGQRMCDLVHCFAEIRIFYNFILKQVRIYWEVCIVEAHFRIYPALDVNITKFKIWNQLVKGCVIWCIVLMKSQY